MSYFSVKNFFNLNEFSFAKFFNEEDLVWTLIKNLPIILSKVQLGKIESYIPFNCYIEDKRTISIGKNTVIEQGAYIKGPALIGDNCVIRHGAYLRGNVLIGSNSIVGHSTEVKNSIFFNKASAAHLAYVGDSILGNNVNLGAGVKLANFRLDKKNISFVHEEVRFETDLKKLGAIVGDNVQIGCNCVLNPGTFVGKDTLCFPAINLSGIIPAGVRVKPEGRFKISKT